MAYADDITITSTHTSTSAAKKYIQPYLHQIFAWTKQKNLLLNPDKTTYTLFTPDPAEYTSNLDLTINNKALPMATHPKVLGLTLDPKLTYSTHIHNISVQAQKPLQIIKALTATGWGKQKETLMATYKAVMRPALEYVSSVWSPIASSTSINKLQVMQNAALRTATGCTQDTNTVKHATHKTNRHINRATHNIQRYNITLTTSQVQEAIKQSKNNNSQGPDKLNIRHLKHIGPLGLAFLTSMFKTALNKNIIPHTWKLANIVPIPKPNKDTNKGTSYRPISLLSVIAKTLEKSLLPYITANIPNTPMQHGYKTQHYTVTALHTLNNTVAKGFNQMAPPARTITVALDMSKAFDTINIHTLIRKLLQTNIPGTIL